MISGFDTDEMSAAIDALLVHAVYRSRDFRRFEVDMNLWAPVERFTKASAKQAHSLPEFVERLKPRMACDSIRSVQGPDGYRDFMTCVQTRPAADQDEGASEA